MIRYVMRMFWFLAFRVLALMQWSAMVSALTQTSTLFKVYSAGQTPVAGMQLLAKLTVSSVFECGRLCWNNGNNAGCEGFLYQSQLCDGNSQSPSQSAGCQLLQFPDVNSLSFQPANTSCSWQFYVSVSTAASQLLYPSIVFNITATDTVRGLTASSDGQVFATGLRKTSNQVGVYNTTTLKLVRSITVDGATGLLNGLAVSSDNKYLYVADSDNSRLFKVNLSSSTTVANWSVAPGPNALSMNSKQNILVATEANKIQEYAQNGSLVRQVTTTSAAFHAVEGSNNLLAVNLYSKNRVSLVAVNGTVLYTFNGTSVLSYSRGLGVDKQGYVFVADQCNNRVLVLNPTLTQARPLRVTGNATVAMVYPNAMWLDPSVGYLYVGEALSRYRVLVFDVSHVSALFDTP